MPGQGKQSHDIGRSAVDNFETAIQRQEKVARGKNEIWTSD